MLHVRILFVVAFFALYFPSLGQYQPVYRHLTVDEGLSASEVYHVYQDSKGYLWFATNNGVSRFDGYSFENFDLVSGLADNTVFEIYEDYKHRIWFIPFSGNLSYYQDGVIKDYPYNSKIKQHFPNSRGPIKLSFYVDTLDNVYLGLKQFGLITISPEGVYKRLEGRFDEGELVMQGLGDGKILTSSPLNSSSCDLIYFDDKQKFRCSFEDLYGEKIVPLYSYAQKSNDGSVFISTNGLIVQIEDGKIIQKTSLGNLIIWMCIDSENNLWVSAFEGGVYIYPNCDISKDPSLELLNDCQVTSVLRDKEGSYWFSTLNDGVFYAPDFRIKTYSKDNGLADNRVNAIFADDDRIYVGFEMGFVDVVHDDKLFHYSIRDKVVNTTYVRSMYGDSILDRVWICTFDELGYFNNGNYRKINSDKVIYPRKIIKSKNGGYWVGTVKGLRKLEDDKIVYDSQADDSFSGTVFSLVEDCKGDIWLSTINGLWKYSNQTYQYLGDQNDLLTRVSHSMFFSSIDSSLWIGTNGAGIVKYHKDGSVTQISVKEGLVSNSIHQLYSGGNSLWVATRQGLSLIPDMTKRDILNFTIDDGLPSNEITSVYSNGNKVYIGTNKGLAVVDKYKLTRNQTPPPTIITRLIVEGKNISLQDSVICLDYSQNTLDISYVGLAYRNMGRLLYRHRMIGLDTNWVYSKATSCLYSGLKSGEYLFQVQSLNSNGVWSASSTVLNLYVNPPFWERTWFVILITLVFAGILYLIYIVRIKEIRRRNDLMNNINLYKQQSLRQQMNPHFIFNTLNSIQYYILERDTISSHKYLTKFARLMRMTLDNSQSSTIPLRDEIDALQIYMELEALRLEGKFTYTIDYGNNDAILDVKIPTLLIQPFVENAIWHGIMLKTEKSGHVNIIIRNAVEKIVCIVEDNGIGREEAKRIQEQNSRVHKSRGFLITQQRIELLNSMYQDKFNIQINDLYDLEGKSCGTQVSITIPKVLGFIV
ncbi:MAG: two-component regulator propeller domain-containing protein [Bacteroidales bacterium]